jgi:hypothetical protein
MAAQKIRMCLGFILAFNDYSIKLYSSPERAQVFFVLAVKVPFRHTVPYLLVGRI